ncbi:stage II sporulation protein P [Brevibacillus ginsengisoli]|uniref:stage II sporulation protein P n=1 Tax=Brevibacillus ginsengisoli TaxID=363854 RepID=UPI003CE8D3B5
MREDKATGGIELAALIQRHFMILSLVTALLFISTLFMANQQNRLIMPSPTIQLATSNLSSLALLQIMSTEIPSLNQMVQSPVESEDATVLNFLFRMATGIQAGDLRSLLGRELPGMLNYQDARFIVRGQKTNLEDLYVESAAPPGIANVVIDETPQSTDPTDSAADQPANEKPKTEPYPTTGKQKVAFVYNTHNRESWLSVAKLDEVTQSVNHPTQNISLVGKHFAAELQDKGIGTVFNKIDFYQQLIDEGKSYPLSYAESLKAVQAVKQENKEMNYFFDLHRDGPTPREKTTISINGKPYARLMFVIGTRNKHSDENAEFAKKLHDLMEKKYPGLSRGVLTKSQEEGNGEYNQSVSPGSLLVEVGGTSNNLQECNRAAEALADVFAEYYWQAERASQHITSASSKR